jgi:hypothetical protein
MYYFAMAFKQSRDWIFSHNSSLHTEVIKRHSIDFIKPQGEIVYFPTSVAFASFTNFVNMAAVKESHWRHFAQFHAFKNLSTLETK